MFARGELMECQKQAKVSRTLVLPLHCWPWRMQARQLKSGGVVSTSTSKSLINSAALRIRHRRARFRARQDLWRRARGEKGRAAIHRRLGIRGGAPLWSVICALESRRRQARALRHEGPRVRLHGDCAPVPSALMQRANALCVATRALIGCAITAEPDGRYPI
jgi:hypothetical protein